MLAEKGTDSALLLEDVRHAVLAERLSDSHQHEKVIGSEFQDAFPDEMISSHAECEESRSAPLRNIKTVRTQQLSNRVV
jgi:hypothetical protein